MKVIKGHTRIELRDAKTGRLCEVHEDDNIITNAITEFFQNLGFTNFQEYNPAQLCETFLGGIMAFKESITENAGTVTLPGGNTMIANGSYDVDNDGDPEEMGSYSNNESGWINNKWVQTYDYSTSQGNGDISCICLTGKDYGYIGEGNQSNTTHATKRSLTSLKGTYYNNPAFEGTPCHVDLASGTMLTVDFSKLTTDSKLVIRKYRIGVWKFDLRGSCVEVEKTEITAPANMVTLASSLECRDTYNALEIYNTGSESQTWGSGHTQYLWTFDPTTKTVAESTLLNTSGETLHGLMNPFFVGDQIVFVDAYSGQYGYSVDTRYVYQLDRGTGVISKIENPFGTQYQAGPYWGTWNGAGWVQPYHAKNGRIVISGNASNVYTYDAVDKAIYVTNGEYPFPLSYESPIGPTDAPLIGYTHNNGLLYLFRKQNYIASINNLASTVHKDNTKTMKIVYTVSFS